VDQGDQFPGNPFHLIGVPAGHGYLLWSVDQGDQFPRNPFHLIGVPVHSQGWKRMQPEWKEVDFGFFKSIWCEALYLTPTLITFN